MNVQVMPAALKEIEVLRAAGYRGTGFLIGSTMGRFILIEQLLAMDFNRKNASTVYGAVCEKYQQRLQGVFFCRRRPFTLDWFLLDLIMAIGRDQIQMFTCEFLFSQRKVHLVPFL
ncbi:MAG: hypothetical protein IH584_04775 [Candidatus Aminicenantes bacterium]|nr:hypothetical protein [Candidatus Aminicenantes bacterium]